ncbi:JAB domain-containing protein [Sphingomonas aurantiaca]|uniref:JAB domain-containing protein n=1 Tax=Sphingomonas aurantiaca TaxID=185949 RepID=UPI00334AE522
MGGLVPPSLCEERQAIEYLLRRSGSAAQQPAIVAGQLIREFGSFTAILAGSTTRLRRAGADDEAIEAFRWCRSAVLLSLRRLVVEKPVIGTSSALRDYLHVDMSTANQERFRTLFLNGKNELLLDETTTGTVDTAPFYARDIVARALEIGATSLILVHNHPSGDPRPSRSDIDATVAFDKICRGLGLVLLDHLIVGRHAIVSLRDERLIGQ